MALQDLTPVRDIPNVALQDLTPVRGSIFRTFSADSSIATDKLAPEQWLEIINQLWFEHNEKGAYAELKNFIEAYPDYPVEDLKKQLPEGMDLSAITR